jgi:putative two-component system response regulator
MASYYSYNQLNESAASAIARHMEDSDSIDGGHCARVSSCAVRFAKSLRLCKTDIEVLRLGGLVHDIGKIAIPDSILFKPGPLNPEEIRIVRRHPVVGEHMCAQLELLRNVLPLVRSHHERVNGSGYPDGLAGREISNTIRILQIVDIYDALTTDRPYRKSLSMPQALAILNDEAGRGWLDSSLIDPFASFIIASGKTATFRDPRATELRQTIRHAARESAAVPSAK